MSKGNFKDVIKNIKKDIKINNKLKSKTMQLKFIIEGAQSLGEIMKIEVPIVLSFKLSMFIKKINPIVEEFNKQRNELLQKYAKPELDKDKKETGQMKFKDAKAVETFNKELNALLDEEVKVEIPDIKISEFGDINIKPTQLLNLDWLIKS